MLSLDVICVVTSRIVYTVGTNRLPFTCPLCKMWLIKFFQWFHRAAELREHKRGIIYIVCHEALKGSAGLPVTQPLTSWGASSFYPNIANNDFSPPKSLLGNKEPWVEISATSIQLRTGAEAVLCNCPTLRFKEWFKLFTLSKRDSCLTFSRPLLRRERLQRL